MGTDNDVHTVTADDGVELHYEVVAHEGDAAADQPLPIVLLHGALAGRRTFSRQHKALAAAGRLIIPSTRGHDDSELTLPADYGIASSEIRDLCAVLDLEQVERLHLIGHSSGGATAFAFAQAFPDRIERLILIEPSLFTLLPAQELATGPQTGAAIIEAAAAGSTAAVMPQFLPHAVGAVWQTFDDDAKSALIAKMGPFESFVVPHLRALRSFNVEPVDLKALHPPTLLFYGQNSFEFEAKIAAQWRAHRPDLELIEVEGAGHNIHRDCADLVNGAILGFLDNQLVTS
jgi:pimeloyl-ACP methyl ester carboxylesterase